jgi:hypothetical protein
MGQADIFAHFMADRKTSAATMDTPEHGGEEATTSAPKKRGRPKKASGDKEKMLFPSPSGVVAAPASMPAADSNE